MKRTNPFLLFTCVLLSACQPQMTTKKENNNATNYQEPHRLQFHFSPPANWMNDPNGMVYYEGEYHLFYQYYPDSTVWGPMHWGHAVSKDLVHWENLPIALYPDTIGCIFSGSAVVDWKNTSGLGKDGQVPMIAIFTQHDFVGEKAKRNDFQNQSIAYSLDKGRTWTMYAQNPVLKNPGIRDFRDPKVSWHEPSQKWIMTLAVQDHISFYSSPDLKNWTHESDFGKGSVGSHGGVWECPDLFQLKVDAGGQNKWVLLVSINPGGPNGGSATQYFIGNFDGKTFTNDNTPQTTLWMDYGRDNYAGVSWSDVPQKDGRRLLLGWMSNWDYAQAVPTEVWRSANTIPRELSLQSTPAGLRLFSTPVKEMTKLRAKRGASAGHTIKGDWDLSKKLGFSPKQMEVILEAEPQDATTIFGIELSNTKGERYRVGYDAATRQFFSDRTAAGKKAFSNIFAHKIHVAPRILDNKTVQMQVFFDLSSAELFGDEGATVLTDLFFPNEDFSQVKLFAEKGEVQWQSVLLYELKSVWK